MNRWTYLDTLTAAKKAATEFAAEAGLSNIEKMNRQLDVNALVDMIEHQVDESITEVIS